MREDRELQGDAVRAEAEGQKAMLAGAGGAEHFREAARLYRESWDVAPPGSYGRLVGMLKAAVFGGGGADEARFALEALGPGAPGATAAYARAIAALVLGDDATAAGAAEEMPSGGEAFARAGDAASALAAGESRRYGEAVRAIVADFEGRELHLTGVPFADTALMFERLAEPRGLAARPSSDLLPNK